MNLPALREGSDLPALESRAESAPAQATGPSFASRLLTAGKWTIKIAIALLLFVGALQVMKTGAGRLEFLKHGGPLVHNGASTLGLGWLGALLVLSGSPIAASALTLVAGGSLSETEGFWMIAGSRVGAAFVVLFVGVIYAMRGGKGKRSKPVATGIIALAVTAVMYVPGATLGAFVLDTEYLQRLDIHLPTQLGGVIDFVYGGLLRSIDGLPGALLFAAGLGILLLSLKLIDNVIPEFDEEAVRGPRAVWLRRKWPMFFLGAFVALVTMSVSVALTVLLPLVARNHLTRRQIIPYIIGANITTLGDTFLAALLLDSAAATSIVLATLIGTVATAVILLTVLYEPMCQGVKKLRIALLMSHARLAAFTAILFLCPIVLLALPKLMS